MGPVPTFTIKNQPNVGKYTSHMDSMGYMLGVWTPCHQREGSPSSSPPNDAPYCPIQPSYNPYIGGICWYICRVLS